ncbi:anthranilate synthase family protein [Sanguibacter sp. HDW7]|uniref:anthranilate synthase family protein n=1 Tax=Sanguibacter sp. HDW7 TaxID=2714931 RepID=UPI0014077E20|nr:chorismate-binding protein [Sanguibacter sp. HDW7]QIK82577.1 chorismate-binding protein [Sanguibacter sp. HDW7]
MTRTDVPADDASAQPTPPGVSGDARVLEAEPAPGADPASVVASLRPPFALLAREGGDVEVLTGTAVDVDLLDEIPLHDAAGRPREVLALVPFRQVRELGFDAVDDDAPLRCLVVDERRVLVRADALAALPAEPVDVVDEGFDIDDDAYAQTVRRVVTDEIGRGSGSSFVVRRDRRGRVDADAVTAALTWFRSLLATETGAYWTFAIVTEGHVAVGATPEVHVSVRDGEVTMTPISGTLRHGAEPPTREQMLEFLASTKETEELFMVVDEELKMMSAVCPDGGRVSGPFLRPMSRLTHTEYALTGRTHLDPRDVLRATMFAPTVTGSPMRSACTVLTRHEGRGRGYYSGVAALFTPRPGAEGAAASHDLDAPILIRTAYLAGGRLTVPAAATIVRHSDPASETAETTAKASGVLGALGVVPRPVRAPSRDGAHTDPGVLTALAARNARLASFWLEDQGAPATAGPVDAPATTVPVGRPTRAVVVDAEDAFTTMLAHQLRHLGLEAVVVPWDAVTDDDLDAADLVVAGPGPGDPRDGSPRLTRLHDVVGRRLAQRRPLLAVCLSHQVVAHRLGLPVEPLPAPRQGIPLEIELDGQQALVGFYNTFAAYVAPGTEALTTDVGEVRVAAGAAGEVHVLRGEAFASVQGHLESVLSRDGLAVLRTLVGHALAVRPGVPAV